MRRCVSNFVPKCRQCFAKPSRAKDEFCSDLCAHDWARQRERTVPVETTSGDQTRSPWSGAHRLNLQNSA